MPVTINASTSTGLVQSADTSGEIELQSNGTTALKVNTNEGIQILNCLGVGNATPSTSGAGITFPATQSASSDGNTLDDYEEGTFTATLVSNGGTNPTVGTYSSRTGTYVKVGRLVFFTLSLNASSISSGSGQMAVSGLPFVNGVGTWSATTIAYNGQTGGTVPLSPMLEQSSQRLSFWRESIQCSWGSVTVVDWYLSGSYYANS